MKSCPHCGARGQWWRSWYVSCLTCGYIPERVHTDRRLEAALRVEVGAREGTHNGSPPRLTAADERALRTLGELREGAEVR